MENWKRYYIALAALAAGGGLGSQVPALTAGDVFYKASFNFQLPANMVSSFDAIVDNASKDFTWGQFACHRDIGTLSGEDTLITSCSVHAADGSGLFLALPGPAQKAFDARVETAKPGFVWSHISCKRAWGTVSEVPTLLTFCSISGVGIASDLASVPTNATVQHQ